MNLIYNGNVEITINHSSRRHNKGSSNLFKLFASLMCGDEYSVSPLPYFIMLYDTDVDSVLRNPSPHAHTEYAALNRKVVLHRYFSDQGIAEDRIYSAIFDTSITREYLSNYVVTCNKENQSIEGKPVLTLALISQDGNSILAAVPFLKEEYDHIVAGGSAIIKWSMSLSNGGDE
jgi:hypothetical protein